MKRAFGSMLIAADADTAAELATRHGLASVTLDGRVSCPGSLQGGWQGSAPRSQTATTILEISRIRVRSTLAASPRCNCSGWCRQVLSACVSDFVTDDAPHVWPRAAALSVCWEGSDTEAPACKQAEKADAARRLEALDSEAAALQQRQRQLQDDVDANLALCLSVQQVRQVMSHVHPLFEFWHCFCRPNVSVGQMAISKSYCT